MRLKLEFIDWSVWRVWHDREDSMSIKERIKKAFDLLSAIPVQGEAVDYMSAARAELRAAYKEAAAEEKESAKEAAENG